jgi:hypothetical protein
MSIATRLRSLERYRVSPFRPEECQLHTIGAIVLAGREVPAKDDLPLCPNCGAPGEVLILKLVVVE